MMYKEFKAEIAKNLAAKVCISAEDMHAAGMYACQVAEKFLESNSEYRNCTYTEDYKEGIWTISFYTTFEVVFKEV